MRWLASSSNTTEMGTCGPTDTNLRWGTRSLMGMVVSWEARSLRTDPVGERREGLQEAAKEEELRPARDALEGKGAQRRPQKRLEEVAKAVGGRLLSVTNAIEAGTWRQGDSGWA